MIGDVDAELERIAKLGKGERFARGSALDSKGIEARIGEVAHPKVETERPKVALCMRAEGGIEVLAERVGLVPVGLSLCGEVETDGHIAQVETVVGVE